VELHPIVVHFPVALLSMALVFDVIGWMRASSSFRSAGLYCLVAGALGTILAVVSGLITPDARERGRGAAAAARGMHLTNLAHFFTGRRVEVHEHWGYILLALAVLWVAVRVALALGTLRRPGIAMIAGVLTCIALLITGYLGGELVYRQRGRNREIGQAAPAVSTPRAARWASSPRAVGSSRARGLRTAAADRAK
jgi:uncharacterized membrane protein